MSVFEELQGVLARERQRELLDEADEARLAALARASERGNRGDRRWPASLWRPRRRRRPAEAPSFASVVSHRA